MNVFKKIILVSKNIILSCFYSKPNVLNSDKTIEYISQNKVNVGRYGDGELDIIKGKDLKFQKYNRELSSKLSELKTNENFLVCIPNIFNRKELNRKSIIRNEYIFWKKNIYLYGYEWRRLFSRKKMLCGDAFISRFYLRYKNKEHVPDYVQKLKKLWDKRNVILVEGENSRIGVGNDILDNTKSIKRILCPSIDAFNVYDKILLNIRKHYKEGDLVLIALGPTATVMAYDLSKENIWALDMGHFDIEYEWYLAKTDHKIPIKHKHVNECDSLGECEESEMDKKYLKEIVEKIKE